VHSLEASPAEEDGVSSEEESSYATSTVMLGGNQAAKSAIRLIKLPEVPKLPPYTTWTFLDRSVYNCIHFSTALKPCYLQKVSLVRFHRIFLRQKISHGFTQEPEDVGRPIRTWSTKDLL
jgi:hypothetical protein